MSIDLNNFIKENVIRLTPYKINEVESFIAIKLDANESNYPLPKKINKNYVNFIKDTPINLYPDSNYRSLIDLLESFFDISSKNFIFGNGSDELILTILLSLKKDIIVNIPEPSFSMYEIIAGYNDFDINRIKLKPGSFNLPEGLSSPSKNKNIYFFSCPNNPTGNYFNPDIIKYLISDKNNLVVVDEAYIDFSERQTLINSISKHQNLIVLRTFSKIGMAGLRFGMLFAGDKLINEFRKIKLPFNVNSLTLKSIEFFLKNFNYFNKNIHKTIIQRNKLYNALLKFDFMKVYPSEANFILIELKDKGLETKFDEFLKSNGLIIRGFGGNMKGFFRISIGAPFENAILINCLKSFK